MDWKEALPADQLKPDDRKTVQVGDQSVLLINHCDTIYAISTTCPHWGLPLETGRLTDDCGLICPWHRSAFDLATGDIKDWAPWPPGLGRVIGATSRRKVLPTYPTRVEDGKIFVSLEAQAESPSDEAEAKPAEAKAPSAKPTAKPADDKPVTIIPDAEKSQKADDKPAGKASKGKSTAI